MGIEPDDELITEATSVLGYKRRGKRIVDALSAGIAYVRSFAAQHSATWPSVSPRDRPSRSRSKPRSSICSAPISNSFRIP